MVSRSNTILVQDTKRLHRNPHHKQRVMTSRGVKDHEKANSSLTSRHARETSIYMSSNPRPSSLALHTLHSPPKMQNRTLISLVLSLLFLSHIVSAGVIRDNANTVTPTDPELEMVIDLRNITIEDAGTDAGSGVGYLQTICSIY